MKLSICMPTYNFGKFIGETLESIIPQLTDDVEILILDGASTDNTGEIIRTYQKQVPQIRYFREQEKGGIDKDMDLSVRRAKGDYCWLFSSDDLMEKRALAKVLEEIDEGHDVYVCGFNICSLDMSRVLKENRFSKITRPTVFNLSDARERGVYFRAAIETPAFFSFMGSLVINRSRWLETSIHPSFFGTCWAHVARIFCMIPHGLSVKHIPSSFLCKRALNDSFMDRGLINRYAIAIDGYQNISDRIFGHDSLEAFHIRKTLRNEFFPGPFLEAKRDIRSWNDLKNLVRLIGKTFSDFSWKKWISIFTVFIVPNRAIPLARVVYRMQKGARARLLKICKI